MNRSNQRQGIILILSAPSGTGKTTLINGLLAMFPELRLSVSYTTRQPRAHEVNGQDYHFVSAQRFAKMRARGEFAEWARVHDFLYGTRRRPLDQSVKKGQDVLLDIDVQGARKIKKSYPEAVSVFLVPPSWEELKRRLAARGTDDREIIARRLVNAEREIQQIISYDYYVINEEVQEALGQLACILRTERLKVSRVTRWRIEPLLHATVARSGKM